ncbi:TIGR02281 family clan AA aspartic protease [Arvimicrobium flavum]|uniref:TIGR02281 family clan AA aspartic protease n=1 Tax=Arvimicrobium flavum TaxID=3393320 RepID=UPI00237B301C|nr:TIGR02281 family clan AA aspartic protease [Mesorhizobium shangrilense]
MTGGRFLWIILGLIGAAAIFLVARDTMSDAEFSGDDGLGQGIYLTILGLVIAAGILGSGRRLGDLARSLALWALIILALVASYQYRYELQDFASRVTAGLVPGSPLSITDAHGGTTVMLDKLPNGHFEAQTQVNGRSVQMMIDTGATTTVLTTRDASRVGIDTASLAFQIPISTANGQALAARIVLDDLSVGAISRRKIPALVASDGMLDQSLLGMNFIGTLSGFDIRGDRMILRD